MLGWAIMSSLVVINWRWKERHYKMHNAHISVALDSRSVLERRRRGNINLFSCGRNQSSPLKQPKKTHFCACESTSDSDTRIIGLKWSSETIFHLLKRHHLTRISKTIKQKAFLQTHLTNFSFTVFPFVLLFRSKLGS